VQSALSNRSSLSFCVFAPDAAPVVSYASRESSVVYSPRLVLLLSNAPPTVSTIPNQTMDRNGSLAVPFTVRDAETPLPLLGLSASSSNPGLLPNANLSFSGSGQNRSLQLVPRTNQLGTATLFVTVNDGLLSATTSFILTVVGSNDAPTSVQFTSPAANAVFASPANIPLSAIANDPNGNLARVDYFLGNAIIGSAASPPFTYSWLNVPPGTYRLRAVATDGGGLSITSALRQIFVGNIVSLIPPTAIWKFYDVTGIDLGTNWRETNYNDSAWPSGHANLGFGDQVVTTVNPDPSRITTYFRHRFVPPTGLAITNLTLGLMRDDGGVVYLNGREVFRSNMPGGSISNATVALSAISGAEETTWFTNKFASPTLRPGTNVIAVEVHQGSSNSSDLGFNLLLVGQAAAPPVLPTMLALRHTLTNINFTWPANSGWNLYATPTLGPGSVWSRVVAGITTTNGETSFSASTTETARFFELRQP
jgi:Bacterial Ig domain